MKTIYLYKREDIPEEQLSFYSPVSGEELRKAGIPMPTWRGETFYLDRENFKIFMEAQFNAQNKNPKGRVDQTTKFIIGSQEYNDYHYPKIDNAGRRR